MGYQEGNRYLYLETPLGDSMLLLQRFTGSEGLNQLFDFELELLAENATTINFDQLIGQRVSFGVVGAEAALIARDFNGIVVEFAQGLRGQEFTAYRMRVAPDIWKLTKKFQSRIFQHITVPDILKQVLTGYDVSYEIQGTFEQREYCTQYRETDFDFLSRLVEEEGIYYFFKFTHGAHKLVLANTPPSHPDIPGDSKVIYETTAGGFRDDERITIWQKEQIWGSGKYTTWDHHFQLPHRHLQAEAASTISVQVGTVSHKLNLAQNENLEIYDYPAAYAQRFDGIDKSGGDQAANLQKISPDAKRTDDIRIQQQETPMLLIQAVSNCRQMTAGHKFTLQRHFNADGKYVVLRVLHSAAEADFRSNLSQKGENHYTNQFACLPYALPFRPSMVTEKPVIAGPQTAVVVGPAGEEIFPDKYGRVKVQFHWDRAGKYDGDSSCWLRVGTLWAGKQWGSIFIPRIGHEVIVAFLEGDPDRPIIVGSVYNADTVPPYELPANKTRSGVKTDSSIGSGGFNEIRFEDKKGSEQIFIHGQKDSDTRIENDAREWIGRDRHLIVKRDKYEEVDRDIHIDIKRDHKEKVEGDRNLTTQGKEAIQVSGTHSLQVTGNVAEQFSGNHAEQTTGSFYLQANNIVVQANLSITLMVGGNFIGIGPSGINILGTPAVLINSGGVAVPGVPGFPVSPAAPGAAIAADQAVAGSEVKYSGGAAKAQVGGAAEAAATGAAASGAAGAAGSAAAGGGAVAASAKCITQITAKVPGTKGKRDATKKRPDDTLTASSSSSESLSANAPVVLVRGCHEVTLGSVTTPPNQPVSWSIKPNENSESAPTLTPTDGGKSATLKTDKAGSFSVIGELGACKVVWNVVFAWVKVDVSTSTITKRKKFADSGFDPDSCNFKSGAFSAGNYAWEGKVKLQVLGGGKDQKLGIDKVKIKILQNGITDSLTGNYDGGGTCLEIPPDGTPILDANDGSQVFVYLSTSGKVTPNSGTDRTWWTGDSPAGSFLKDHHNSGKPLKSISGVNAFDTAVASVSDDAPNSILVHAEAKWTADFSGSVAANGTYTPTTAAVTGDSKFALISDATGGQDACDAGFETFEPRFNGSITYRWTT
jgi:type VI secretion system secreted protein VgrG